MIWNKWGDSQKVSQHSGFTGIIWGFCGCVLAGTPPVSFWTCCSSGSQEWKWQPWKVEKFYLDIWFLLLLVYNSAKRADFYVFYVWNLLKPDKIIGCYWFYWILCSKEMNPNTASCKNKKSAASWINPGTGAALWKNWAHLGLEAQLWKEKQNNFREEWRKLDFLSD